MVWFDIVDVRTCASAVRAIVGDESAGHGMQHRSFARRLISRLVARLNRAVAVTQMPGHLHQGLEKSIVEPARLGVVGDAGDPPVDERGDREMISVRRRVLSEQSTSMIDVVLQRLGVERERSCPNRSIRARVGLARAWLGGGVGGGRDPRDDWALRSSSIRASCAHPRCPLERLACARGLE